MRNVIWKGVTIVGIGQGAVKSFLCQLLTAQSQPIIKSLPCHFLYCKIALINLVRRGLRFLDLFSVEKEGMFIYFYIEHIFNGLLDGFDTRVTKF
jgi:hypothetical protein